MFHSVLEKNVSITWIVLIPVLLVDLQLRTQTWSKCGT